MVTWASGNHDNRSLLWNYARSEDRRTSVNALWVITHLPETDSAWIMSLRDQMIDILLAESDIAKRRILLQILREQDYGADDIRTDFMDYCLSKINSECEPYAIRCSCIYLAFKMCRHYPELVAELEGYLDLMSLQSMSPGLHSAIRQTKAKVKKIKTTFPNHH